MGALTLFLAGVLADSARVIGDAWLVGGVADSCGGVHPASVISPVSCLMPAISPSWGMGKVEYVYSNQDTAADLPKIPHVGPNNSKLELKTTRVQTGAHTCYNQVYSAQPPFPENQFPKLGEKINYTWPGVY